MPRLAICSHDLHWQWIIWTLLCDTMEVSMLRLAWLTTAQHVFQPALTGRLELVSRKIVSRGREQRWSRWANFAKNCLPRIGSKELPWFREKYRVLGRQKNGVQHATAIYPISRYTRPRYIGTRLYYIGPHYNDTRLYIWQVTVQLCSPCRYTSSQGIHHLGGCQSLLRIQNQQLP